MANELKEKHQRLKKVRTRNIVLNSICILLAGSGIWWTANYFWRYINYEVTNDAFVDQYIAPLNIRASGYIKEVDNLCQVETWVFHRHYTIFGGTFDTV